MQFSDGAAGCILSTDGEGPVFGAAGEPTLEGWAIIDNTSAAVATATISKRGSRARDSASS